MTSEVFQLCDEYVTRSAALDPVSATMRGVVAEFVPATDYGPEGLDARAELMRQTLRRLEAVAARAGSDGGLSSDDQVAAGYLRERLTADLAQYDTGEMLRQLRAPFGLVQTIRDSVELLPRTGEEAWERVVARLTAVPEMLGSWRRALELGVQRGLVASRRQAVESSLQADRLAGRAGVPATFTELRDGYGDGPLAPHLAAAADTAHAAYAELARYLRDGYAPHAVERDGVGPQRYALASRLFLGADIDPAEAYAWGWEELHRIEDEMVAEAGRVRAGATVDEATEILNASAYVDGAGAYRGWLQEQHDQAIDRLHGRHFDIAEPLRRVDVVLATSSSSGAAYYTPPSEDLSRPGRTWWPVAERERFTTWDELTTVFHEGVPGHHLQLGQARVAAGRLSRFTRTFGVSGHAEGWALYSERLADELGWFTTPGDRLGMLMASAMRATRVVLDIGLHLDLPMPPAEAQRHGPQWTFEVAEQVLRERGRAAGHQVHPEVVRYTGWPAQAISYKLGERAWLAARDEARARPGFDLRAWHTQALSLGSVGLAGLAEALRRL
ncbi:MAG TPA: DUF885 domain-containing protein [Micromonosporaceae bacterium]|nr:DUF885 domain-containing protein [Micromonosporaceae bacterium]